MGRNWDVVDCVNCMERSCIDTTQLSHFVYVVCSNIEVHILRKPDRVADNKMTMPYGDNVAAPAIKLPDTKEYHEVKIREAENKLKARYEELQEEFKKLVETAADNELIYSADVRFKPTVGKVYHLYRRDDGGTWVSMVAPDEWGPGYNFEFLGSFRLATDSVWIRE